MTFIVSVIENPKQQNCFGYILSTPNSTPSSSNFGVFHCVQMSANNPSEFVIQTFGDRPPFNFLLINSNFASISGIKQGDELLMEPVSNLPTCISMEIEPDTFEDWNIIESTACIIEEIFLDQIRVVSVGMKFVLFVAPGVPAKFRVLKTEPDTSGRESAVMATNITEVLVAPRRQPQNNSNNNEIRSTRASSIKPSIVDKLTNGNTVNGFLKEFIHPGRERLFRVLPKEFLEEIEFDYRAFGHQSFIIALNEEKTTFIKKSIISLRPKFSKISSDTVFAILFEIPSISDSENMQRLISLFNKFPQHCIVSHELESNFSQCSWVKIKYLDLKNIQPISTLNISYSIQNENEEIPTKILKAFLMNYFLNDEIFVPILMDSKGFQLHYKRNDMHTVPSLNLTVTPSTAETADDRCFVFWIDEFPAISTFPILSSQNPQSTTSEKVQSSIFENFGSLKSKKSIFNFQKESIENLENKLTKLSKANEKVNLLLIGENGSGRTNFIKFLAQNLFSNECFFSSIFDCFEWKGKSLETIEKQLDEAIDCLEARMPAVLFLDNLNFLNITMDDEDRKKFIDKVYSRIATRLDKSKVHCIATTRSLYQLPESLLTIDGRRLFHEIVELPTMNQNERENVLKELLGSQKLEFNHEIRTALENLTLGEIVKVAERSKIHIDSLKKEPSEAVKAAIEATPTAGKQIQRSLDEKPVTFSSIGGLKKVKKQLTEIFLWPSKYANLYQKCGLRIGGGAILYGPTGCGKTLIARAISHESKFNVINVKGPELLSKYIGASEQNVRDVFERARATKPSLIIFDEFDALAPKRGHDSTGVTDRVVNQLLTELDGVESTNDGIYILAATNRMDLIDAALLRPGRFDHKVFVDLPDKDEREEIIEKLCDGIDVDENVRFKDLAEITQNWTGADLRGLVINASFAAADDNPNNDSPIIEMNHFKSAINNEKNKKHKKQQQQKQKQQVSSRVTLA